MVISEQNIPVEDVKSLEWHRMAAEQGSLTAQKHMANIYLEGDGVDQSREEAEKWLRLAAEQGDAESQYQLFVAMGDRLIFGDTEADREAVKWLTHSAKQNHAPAQTMLGRIYLIGGAVEVDKKKALDLFLLAAEQDEPDAIYQIGRMYESGEVVKQSDELALSLYVRAGNLDHGDAAYKCGRWLEEGRSIEQDKENGLNWIITAAHNGHEAAQVDIAKRYDNGLNGVEQDRKIAASWYYAAANFNHSGYANVRLGQMYENGEGVPQSNAHAYVYYKSAWFVGGEQDPYLDGISSDSHCEKMEGKMTEEEKQQAELLEEQMYDQGFYPVYIE